MSQSGFVDPSYEQIILARFVDSEYEPRPLMLPELSWYSSEPMQEVEASLSILSMCGVTSE